MDFNELLNDIAKLEGLNLQSIRPGANITIEKVDLKQGKIIVINSSGKIFSRSIIEFQRIWKELLSEPAVRVEEVLRGSGSSRNQPETIFANLPYIEWLKITNKKHIAFVQKATHPYGTLKEMDDINAENIKERIAAQNHCNISSIIVSDNLNKAATLITSLSGVSPVSLSVGTYLFSKDDQSIAIVDANKYNIPVGTYGQMLKSQSLEVNYRIEIDGISYGLINRGQVCVFFRLEELE